MFNCLRLTNMPSADARNALRNAARFRMRVDCASRGVELSSTAMARRAEPLCLIAVCSATYKTNRSAKQQLLQNHTLMDKHQRVSKQRLLSYVERYSYAIPRFKLFRITLFQKRGGPHRHPIGLANTLGQVPASGAFKPDPSFRVAFRSLRRYSERR